MMFLFFIMIVSIVMYVMSMEFKKNLAKESEQKVAAQVSQQLTKYADMLSTGELTIEELQDHLEAQKEIKELSTQNTRLVKENVELTDAIEQIKADLASGLTQTTTENTEGLVIFFERNDISLSPETSELVKSYIEKNIKGKNPEKIQVVLMAGDNPNAPTISVSRELGLARTLNIRNAAINLSIPAGNISVKFIQPKSIDGSYNWVTIKVVE